MIKYSVVTPVFNRSDCVERCLESVTRNLRERDDIEHIVVDDGSTDSSAMIMRKYQKEHSHVRCIFFPHNRGTNAARNAAIASAKGKFCIILDSDDYWDENALATIDKTVSAYPYIRHFCFAPDDMLQTYAKNPLLAGKPECILSFADFLLGRVSGDFVHVMSTDIVRRHPFDEELRIYEGVFFLAFYKESKTILFVNKVVSHRERGRDDSVSYDFLRTNRKVVERTIKAEELLVEGYTADMDKTEEGIACLYQHYLTLLDNYNLLCEYEKAKATISNIEKLGGYVVPYTMKWICSMHLGKLYFFMLKLFLQIKYNVLRFNVK